MAELTVQQQPVVRRLGVLVRAVPRLRRRARSAAGSREPDRTRAPVRQGVLSLHLDLVVRDDDGAAATLERILGVLQPGDRVYLVGPPGVAEPQVDDRPFTIWA
jgi:NADPH-dependent ferric siderophore reductase